MVRGQLRFLGTVGELQKQMSLESTSLEQLYLELTAPGAAGPRRRRQETPDSPH
jgi:hypothetical protein